MSLINNMLKDLEKRKTPTVLGPEIHLFQSTQKLKTNRNKFVLTGGLLIFILLLSLIVNYFYSKHNLTSINIPPNSSAPIKPQHAVIKQQMNNPAPAKDASEAVKITEDILITGMAIEVKNDVTEMNIMLNKKGLYRLATVGENQFLLTFDHAQMQSALPQIDYLHSAFENVTMKNSQNGMQFNLYLNKDASIKSVAMDEKSNQPVLTLQIEYHVQAKNELLSDNNIFKKPVMQTVILQQYQAAQELIQQGQTESAIKRLANILEFEPNYIEARLALVALLLQEGALDRANQMIDVGLKLTPASSPLIQLKARYLVQTGHNKEALRILQMVSPSVEDDPDYHSFMAALYEQNNQDVLAVKIYQQLLTFNDHNGNWWFGLGVSYEKLGQNNAAIDAFSRAMTEGNLDPAASTYMRERLQNLRDQNHENY